MEINVQNMTNPPEKMRLMFEAVSELLRQQRDINSIKVADITSIAGIGKGTAYEYFSSKEEIILNALMYEYSSKLQRLAKIAFEPVEFRDRVYRIMDWILENKEYNQMFTQLIGTIMGSPMKGDFGEKCENTPFIDAAKEFILSLIDKFMEEGYSQGAFTETDPGKRSLALLTAMVEYSFVIMGPRIGRYAVSTEEELREFVYSCLIKSLT